MNSQAQPVEPVVAKRTELVLFAMDDERLRCELGVYLRRQGFPVFETARPDLVRSRISAGGVAVVVMDAEFAGGDARGLRGGLSTPGSPPLILLTAEGEPLERVIGLEVGADDCISKPVLPRELLARVRALLRRLSRDPDPLSDEQEAYRFSGCLLPLASQRLYLPSGRIQHLARGEFLLLQLLLEHPQQLLLRSQILTALGGLDTSERSVDTRVRRLRAKLAGEGCGELIKTAYRGGYLLDSAVQRVPFSPRERQLTLVRRTA